MERPELAHIRRVDTERDEEEEREWVIGRGCEGEERATRRRVRETEKGEGCAKGNGKGNEGERDRRQGRRRGGGGGGGSRDKEPAGVYEGDLNYSKRV